MLDLPKQYKKGITGTIIFHIVLGFIFILFGYSTPLPLPPEQGILINFGNSDNGSGTIEPVTEQENIKIPQNSNSEVKQESILTQDNEEAPEIHKKENIKKNKQETTDKVDQKEEEISEPEEETRNINPLALYKGKTNDSNSEGINSGESNQGRETGSPESNNYSEGKGLGGDGISFNLAGRAFLSLPEPEYNYQVEGKVVVEITVDKYGNVTNATPGIKGSTTLNAYLLKAAKDAALKAKFDRKPDAPAYQKGTITYKFLLQ